ncbi:EpsD family peptidyl-prolyl cis-trans isomerase [Methylotetracoccus oryzae]|uniref:EpsD family peptidyl-prolyl cis-trans isomerase n=1 Tax=Methylotetracoccus oryzae TaxID=1919059 RepID=UPI0011181C56|nr:EpsD family peptidyl-prolyl cis-trans isomerase [Methylotetracoccus oryzae]
MYLPVLMIKNDMEAGAAVTVDSAETRRVAVATWLRAVAVCCLPIILAGVGCKPKPNAGGQVAAQVNGQEVTVHELNQRLANVELPAPELASKVKQEILDELIDRELLMQRAVDMKLDRDPQVMRAIEQARANILAEAVLERRAAGRPEPTAEQVQAFQLSHPELFAKRRVYELGQFTVARDGLPQELLAKLEGARSEREVEQALNAAKVDYALAAVSRGAEQLPMELARKLLPMAKGDIVIFRDGPEAQLIFIRDFREEPLDSEQARVNIKEYLVNLERQTVLAALVKELREKAEIRYLGEFERAAVADPSPEKPQDKPALPGQTLPSHVERGLSGLVK